MRFPKTKILGCPNFEVMSSLVLVSFFWGTPCTCTFYALYSRPTLFNTDPITDKLLFMDGIIESVSNQSGINHVLSCFMVTFHIFGLGSFGEGRNACPKVRLMILLNHDDQYNNINGSSIAPTAWCTRNN